MVRIIENTDAEFAFLFIQNSRSGFDWEIKPENINPKEVGIHFSKFIDFYYIENLISSSTMLTKQYRAGTGNNAELE